MSRIPRDIDALLWTVAESGDAQAIDEFGVRYPEFRGELGRRIGIVRSLRATAKGSLAASVRRARPAFQRPAPAPAPKASKWIAGSLAAAALAAAAFATYLAVNPPPAPILEPETTVNQQNPAPQPQQRGEGGGLQKTPVGSESGTGQTNAEVLAPQHAWERPVDFEMDRAKLLDVMRAIAAQCGLVLTVAPEMPNPEVSVKFTGLSGLTMLQALGYRFGFSALDEGSGRVLLIPAVEKNALPPSGMERAEIEGGKPKAADRSSQPVPNGDGLEERIPAKEHQNPAAGESDRALRPHEVGG